MSEVWVSIENGFLNGEGVDDRNNVTRVKSYNHPQYGRLPYVSAQALRKWLRETLVNLSDDAVPNYYDRVQDNFQTASSRLGLSTVDPVLSIEDDLFGYTHPFINHKDLVLENQNTDRPRVVSVNRLSPIRTTIMSPVLNTTLVSRDNGFIHLPDDTPLPYSNEFIHALYEYTAALELHRVGVFDNKADLIELDPLLESNYLRDRSIVLIKEERNLKRYALSSDSLGKRRASAATLFLKALKSLNGGAKSTQYLSALSPKIVVLSLQKSGNPWFMGLVEAQNNELRFNVESLKERLSSAPPDEFVSDIYIGIRSSFIKNQDEIESLDNVSLHESSDFVYKIMSPGKAIDSFLNAIPFSNSIQGVNNNVS